MLIGHRAAGRGFDLLNGAFKIVLMWMATDQAPEISVPRDCWAGLLGATFPNTHFQGGQVDESTGCRDSGYVNTCHLTPCSTQRLENDRADDRSAPRTYPSAMAVVWRQRGGQSLRELEAEDDTKQVKGSDLLFAWVRSFAGGSVHRQWGSQKVF